MSSRECPSNRSSYLDGAAMVAQKRVAIYARVSTVDKGQDPETQLLGLREYAHGANLSWWRIRRLCEWHPRGPHAIPSLTSAARKRQLDVVLVWRYDRFARSTPALVNALQEFHSLGVDFISYQEHIDTTTPQGASAHRTQDMWEASSPHLLQNL